MSYQPRGAHSAPPPQQGGKERSLISDLLEWAIIIVIALAAAFAVRTWVVEPFEIPTESMVSTIEVGDRILGEKISYLFTEPQAGDIITFEDPEDASTTLIKRVIATPGQTIDLRNGTVYIDGVAQDEPYTNGLPTYPLNRTMPGLAAITYPYTLGADEYWVMGDNRTNSLDSRYFGPIQRDSITSRGWITFWPLNDFKVL